MYGSEVKGHTEGQIVHAWIRGAHREVRVHGGGGGGGGGVPLTCLR